MAVAHSSGAAAQPEALPRAPLFATGWVRGEHPGLLSAGCEERTRQRKIWGSVVEDKEAGLIYTHTPPAPN